MGVKGGASQETIFHTIRILKEKGLSVDEAIVGVESILRGKLPEHLVDMIKERN